MMIEPPRPRRGSSDSRSPVAQELLLNLFALLGAAMLVRFLLLLLGVSGRVWIGETTYKVTNPIVRPLLWIPGADTTLIGAATLADVTLVALVILIPLGMVANRRSG